MQRLEVSGAVRPIYVSLGVKRLRQIGLILMYLPTKQQGIIFFLCGAAGQVLPRPPYLGRFEITHTHIHIHTQPVALLWTSDQLVAGATNYTTHNKHTRRTSISLPGFELAIPATEWPQANSSGRTTTVSCRPQLW